MLGSLQRKTVQVHVTRNCNLQCRHCYSDSGPQVQEELPIDTLIETIDESVARGYETISYSGGEPLLYPHLEEAISHSAQSGLRVSIVTNGTLLNRKVWERVAPNVDVIAISVDGPPEIHNFIRRSETAFSSMESNLPFVRDSGVPFGFIHTATAESLPHLPGLAEYAVENGASLLHLHPLGFVGAASKNSDLDRFRNDGESMTRLYLLARALQEKHGEALKVHVDLFNREIVRNDPSLVYATAPSSDSGGKLSELVNPLVVMASGDLSPVCHGLHPRFRIGNAVVNNVGECIQDYLRDDYQHLRNFCAQLLARILPQLNWPYFNWYEILERASFEPDYIPGKLCGELVKPHQLDSSLS